MNFQKGNIARVIQIKPSTAGETGWEMTFTWAGEATKCFLFPSPILSVLVAANGMFPQWKAATLPEEAVFHRQILWRGQLLVGQSIHQGVIEPAGGLASHSLRTGSIISERPQCSLTRGVQQRQVLLQSSQKASPRRKRGLPRCRSALEEPSHRITLLIIMPFIS